MTIIDQTCDPGFGVLKTLIDRYPGLYDAVKTAEILTDDTENLPSRFFAMPSEQRLPLHTPEHTLLSLAYTKVASAPIPPEAIRALTEAATVHQVDVRIFEEDKTAAAAESPEDYLLPEKRRFQVKTAADVSLAEHLFFEKYAQLSLEDRAVMARNLVDAAERHKVELHPSTLKMACVTMTSTQCLRDWLRAREEAATQLGSKVASAYAAMEQAFKHADPYITDKGDQLKLASAIDELDQKAGLPKFYGTKLADPLASVYNTDQVATDYVKVGSALANKELLSSLPLTFWQDALGDDIAQEIAPTGQVDPNMLEQLIPTLPADMKTALESQLAAYNT